VRLKDGPPLVTDDFPRVATKNGVDLFVGDRSVDRGPQLITTSSPGALSLLLVLCLLVAAFIVATSAFRARVFSGCELGSRFCCVSLILAADVR
jgi:hypothetical protein